MDDSVDKEVPQTFSSKVKLAEHLDLTEKSFNEWVNGGLFQKAFQILLNDYIRPEQQKARGSQRIRGPSAGAVEVALKCDDNLGEERYSGTEIDKTGWTKVDHYACAMDRLLKGNIQNRMGLFWKKKKQIRPHLQFCKLWSVLQFMLREEAPSRKDRSTESAEKRKAKEQERLLKASHDTTPSKKHKSGETTESPAPPTQKDDHQDEPMYDPASHMEEGSDEEELRNLEARLTNAYKNPSTVKTLMNMAETGGLSIEEQLEVDEHSKEKNLSERYWQHKFISQLLQNSIPGEMEDAEVTDLATTHDVEDEVMRKAINSAKEDQDLLPFAVATEADFKAYSENSILQDNPRLHPDLTHEEACQKYGLDPGCPRFKSMPTTYTFKFWQVVAISGLRKFEHNKLHGALLCDTMGLGKTLEVIGFLLAYLYIREKSLSEGRLNSKALPHLVVVPPWLFHQWCEEVQKFAGSSLTLVPYYGDQTNTSNKTLIGKTMTRTSPIFDGQESRAKVVVVTTPGTLVRRHGPKPLHNWRINTKKFTKKQAGALAQTSDRDWPGSLEGCFNYCLVDEAQVIKNRKSAIHLTVLWLRAQFTILMTATPEENSIKDLEGLTALIEPKSDPWSTDNLQALGVDEDVNPYELADVHQAAKLLRPTVRALKKFILTQAISEATRGSRLAAFYQSCTIRRTHASILNGKKIGDEIPPCTQRQLLCRLTEAEMIQYCKDAENPQKNLVRYDKKKRKIFWNWQFQRELILLSTWLGFKKIERQFMADHTEALLAKQDKLLPYIMSLYCKANNMEQPTTDDERLSWVLDGGPKLRNLLMLVKGIVILREEKITIFVTLPAQLVLLMALFRALGLSAAALHGAMSTSEKAEIVKDFTTQDAPMILLGSMKGMSVGYNLQHKCRWAVFLDPPPSQPLGDSAAARVHRLGQIEPVEVVTLSVPNTFNDRQIQNNFRKAIPNVLAMMDQVLFGIATGKGGKLQADEDEFITSEWVNHEGRLVKADDPEVKDLGLKPLHGMELVRQILRNKMGVEVTSMDQEELGASSEKGEDDKGDEEENQGQSSNTLGRDGLDDDIPSDLFESSGEDDQDMELDTEMED